MFLLLSVVRFILLLPSSRSRWFISVCLEFVLKAVVIPKVGNTLLALLAVSENENELSSSLLVVGITFYRSSKHSSSNDVSMQRGPAEESSRLTPSLLTRSKAFMGDLLSRPHSASASTATSRSNTSFPKVSKAGAFSGDADSSSAVTRARLSKSSVPPNSSSVLTRTRFSKQPVVPPITSSTKVERMACRSKTESSEQQSYKKNQRASIEAPATQFRYKTPPSEDLLKQLSDHSLVHCHGVLHAAGMRCFSDLAFVNQAELRGMKFNAEDFARLWKLLQALQRDTSRRTKLPSVAINKSLTSSAPGAFEIPYRPLDFKMEQITPSIFKGRFMNVEQCQQIMRMSEAYAYENNGWRPEIYTLTNLDLHIKAIPGMMEIVHPIIDQIMNSMKTYFPACVHGSTRYRNDNEPHLVKYTGEAHEGVCAAHQGVCMHTDSADITLNVALSDPADFEGGGTYFEEIDSTIVLQQGEMIVHLGALKHSGVSITSGIRHILVAFMTCNWN